MGTVEWIEIATLFILVVFTVGTYRFLGAYTAILREHRAAIDAQARKLDDNASSIEHNAQALATLHEGIRSIGTSFEAIRTALEPSEEASGHDAPPVPPARPKD